MAGEHLDLTSGGEFRPRSGRVPAKRRYVGIHFVCCDVYIRVYVNQDETAYVGNCPRCSRQVRLGIGPDGTDSRFFTAF